MIRRTTCILTQPVLMSCGTTFVEVSDLTLLLGRDKFGCEWQTNSLPTLSGTRCATPIYINMVVRLALVPHTLAAREVILDRTIEFFLIHQQMVIRGYLTTLHKVTLHARSEGFFHTMIIGCIVVIIEYRFDEVCTQYTISSLVVIS